MCIFLVLIVSINEKVIEVKYTESPPIIDGYIEEIWRLADSVSDFIQWIPYEKKDPTERTVAYILQDENNLYIAYRCHTKTREPTICLGANEDHISFYLDTFNSNTTAYVFKTTISGTILDGMYFDDGRNFDGSWDGVWYRATKVYDNRYEIEVRIPFKSIRYKKGLSDWGVNFKRFIAYKNEYDFWTEYTHETGFRISRFGILKGINPQATGHYIELYPEGFVKYEEYEEEDKIKPSVSMNVKWDITPQISLNATALPDFAQIESDPFTLNLSRYPTYLSERRPFFIEGSEVFRMSEFGEHEDWFTPLNLFHSRKIGKSVASQPVQIIGGMKLTAKTDAWNFGALGAYTDSLYVDSLKYEPHRGFVVSRIRRKLFGTSDVGMMFSSSFKNKEDYNYALGFDGVYRSERDQFIFQGAASNRNGRIGWAGSAGFHGFIKDFMTKTSLLVIQDSFDVSEIGFVPWLGRKHFMLQTGPFMNFEKGKVKELFIGPGIYITQEPGVTDNWSKGVYLAVSAEFRSNWGFYVEGGGGPFYEQYVEYFDRYFFFVVWGNRTKFDFDFGGSFDYGYNYFRNFLAYQASHWCSFRYSIISSVHLNISTNAWVEWDTLNNIIAITPNATPRIEFTITPDMTLSIFNEFVMNTPQTDFNKTELYSNRLGLLFSWNFLPKSWFYLAINDYQEQDEQGSLQPLYRIAAIKAKYLLYF